MYTQCPECETTFKLGAEDLRRANGKVRCGECDHVFNAIDYLAEEVEESAEDLPATAAAAAAEDGWTRSDRNPSGELDPDLDNYESSAYLEQEENLDEFGEPDDEGPIMYIGGDDDDQDHDAPEADAAAGDLSTDEDVDFDDDVWDTVTGVATEPDDEHSGEASADDSSAETDTVAVYESATPGDDESDDESDNESDDDTHDAENSLGGDDLEFNVPEDKWSHFFGPLPKGQTAAVWQPPQLDSADNPQPDDAWSELAGDEYDADQTNEHGHDPAHDNDTGHDEADDEADHSLAADGTAPSWKDTATETSNSGLYLFGGIALALILVTQLVHYNRDRLAASESWGNNIRAVYGSFGATLYPDWRINDYEIRGSEAVAGETGRDVLDIRAQIANTGSRATGLPRLRILLKDRWSNPVAAQDFSPAEYNSDLAADGLLQPGEIISAHVSIQDPGSGAQGFEVELCLPRRDLGLECTGQPFK